MDFVLSFIRVFIWILCSTAPWLLLGFAVSGVMSLFFTPDRVKKHLGGTGFTPVLKALLIGIPLPLCSCGVLPVAASLRKEGASRGAVAAFYVATPQIGVNSLVLTVSLMGWIIGAMRALIAFVTGMICGLLVGRIADSVAENSGETEGKHEKKSCCCHCCSAEKHSFIYRILDYGFNKMVAEVAPSMMAGLLVAALIQVFLPDDFGASFLKGHPVLEFVGLILIAIPMYVCSSGAVPIAAALVMKGVSPGAALVFLLAGPASNAAMIVSMGKVLGTKATVLYILVLAVVAVAAGVLLNMTGISLYGDGKECCGNVLCISVMEQVCGAVLIALMARSLIVKRLLK